MSIATNQSETLPSPLRPSSLVALLLRPREFFANIVALTKRPEAYLVAWITGTSYVMDRIDTNIMKAELGGTRSGWQAFGPWLSESWVHYWCFVLGVGILDGWTFWYIGGWWYRKRLNWSGDGKANPDRVRATYVYQDLVGSGPAILLVLVQTVVFANYGEAWRAEELWSSLIIVFIFWSCVTSYKAARTFDVVRWKARLWFLFLPIAVYIVGFGLVGALYALQE
jgi:hypothetical protein